MSLTWLFSNLSSCWKDVYWICLRVVLFSFFFNVCKICKCCMYPYLLCNYRARAMLALLATFFNYCNSLLVGFPDSERRSRTVSKRNGQPLSQHKALLSSYSLTLLIFETTSRSLSWRLAARVWLRRFGLKFMPSEGISALSGEVSSAGNGKCGSLFQALLPICCVTKHPHTPISPCVWHGSYYLPSSVNLFEIEDRL